AYRLGFKHAIIPKEDELTTPGGMRVVQTDSLGDAMGASFDPAFRPPPRRSAGQQLADVFELGPDDVWDNYSSSSSNVTGSASRSPIATTNWYSPGSTSSMIVSQSSSVPTRSHSKVTSSDWPGSISTICSCGSTWQARV